MFLLWHGHLFFQVALSTGGFAKLGLFGILFLTIYFKSAIFVLENGRRKKIVV
jgi:hypothetical protein